MENLTESLEQNATNASANVKIPATPEGMLIAYSSLLIMSLLPIYFGAFRSLRFVKKQKETGQKMDTISQKDAFLFPFIASFALLSLYIIYKLVPREYITMLLMSYFFLLGVFALSHIFSPIITSLIPASITSRYPNFPYHLSFKRGAPAEEVIFDLEFCTYDVIGFVLCAALGLSHLYTKHWITNNIFGLAFCLNGIELIHLASFKIGAVLLGGLFFYDIFWVFKTDVMVTVAKNVEAPIKLMFPQDLLEKGLMANNCAMLGLGDVVIPGIFIALMLRFDHHRSGGSRHTFFNSTFLAYISGLGVTIFVMHFFKHAQPALLYLVPACLGAPLLVSLVTGSLQDLISYTEEEPPAVEEQENKKGK